MNHKSGLNLSSKEHGNYTQCYLMCIMDHMRKLNNHTSILKVVVHCIIIQVYYNQELQTYLRNFVSKSCLGKLLSFAIEKTLYGTKNGENRKYLLKLKDTSLCRYFLFSPFVVTPFWSITNIFHYIITRLMKLGLMDV